MKFEPTTFQKTWHSTLFVGCAALLIALSLGCNGEAELDPSETACNWDADSDHIWGGHGAGSHNTFAAGAEGPSTLDGADSQEIAIQSWEFGGSAPSARNFFSMAVASTGMTIVLFRSQEAETAGPTFDIHAYDSSGDEMWKTSLGEVETDTFTALINAEISLLDDCQVGVTLEEYVHIIDGHEGTVESEIELDGITLGGLHTADDGTVSVASNTSSDGQELQVTVEVLSDDLDSASAIYEGDSFEFVGATPRVVYDERTERIFVPASYRELTGLSPQVTGASGVAGIDVHSGDVDTTSIPELDDLLDSTPGLEIEPAFVAVRPFAIEGSTVFFYADNTELLFIGRADTETGDISWLGMIDDLADTLDDAPAFQGTPNHIIASESNAAFSLASQIFSIGNSGETTWTRQISGGNWSSAATPSMVGDNSGHIYAMVGEDTGDIAIFSDHDGLEESTSPDEDWMRMRPVAVGADASLMLEATKLDCDDDDECEATSYLLSLW